MHFVVVLFCLAACEKNTQNAVYVFV